MNLPASNLNLQSILGGASMSGESNGIVTLPGQGVDGQAIELSEFSSILMSPEVLASFLDKLRELLPEAAVKQIEAMLSSGKGLPDTADIAALIDQVIAAVAKGEIASEGDLPLGEAVLDPSGQAAHLLTEDGEEVPQAGEIAETEIKAEAEAEAESEGGEIASELVSFIASLIKEARKSETAAIDGQKDIPAGEGKGESIEAVDGVVAAKPGLENIVAGMAGEKTAPSVLAATPPRAEVAVSESVDNLRRQFQRPTHENLTPRELAAALAAEEGDDLLSVKLEKELPYQRQVLGTTVRELAHERSAAFNQLMSSGTEKISAVLNENNPGLGGIAKMSLDVPTGMTPLQKPVQTAPPPLNVPLGGKAWGDGLGNRITWMLGQNVQQASLRITPPHLGPIEIKIAVNNDQTNVIFSAQHSAVRDALEAAIPRLREMFNENNMQLVNVDVGQRETGGQRAMDDFLFRGDGDGVPGDEHADQNSAEEINQDGVGPARLVSDGLVDDYA
ncbi:MAG: flagellar hook-length control protein FliK [Candidatus Sedimenticola sp. PURPLELP]